METDNAGPDKHHAPIRAWSCNAIEMRLFKQRAYAEFAFTSITREGIVTEQQGRDLQAALLQKNDLRTLHFMPLTQGVIAARAGLYAGNPWPEGQPERLSLITSLRSRPSASRHSWVRTSRDARASITPRLLLQQRRTSKFCKLLYWLENTWSHQERIHQSLNAACLAIPRNASITLYVSRVKGGDLMQRSPHLLRPNLLAY